MLDLVGIPEDRFSRGAAQMKQDLMLDLMYINFSDRTVTGSTMSTLVCKYGVYGKAVQKGNKTSTDALSTF